MEAAERRPEKQEEPQAVPDYLIYELLDGRPLYYKGYRSVLSGELTLDDIMGSSGLQSVIIEYLLRICFSCFDPALFRVLTNEIGSHLSKRNNLSNDIAIFDKQVLTADKVGPRYIDVPAKIVFEIDLDAELEDLTEHEYMHTKVQKMLDFGVEKVFWIMTKTQRVLRAIPCENWELIDWNRDIQLHGDYSFNIGRHLREEGVEERKL